MQLRAAPSSATAWVTDTDIEHLKSLLDDLRTGVEHNLDSEPDLRDFLLHHTQAMTEALDVLVISGPPSLEAATDQALGATNRMAPEMAARGYCEPSLQRRAGRPSANAVAGQGGA